MLDVLSGGRLVAGFPVGTSMDTNFAYGVTRRAAPRALLRSPRPDHAGLDRQGRLPLQRQVQPAPLREPLAAARCSSRTRRSGSPAAAPSRRGSGAPIWATSTPTSATAATSAPRPSWMASGSAWTDMGKEREPVPRRLRPDRLRRRNRRRRRRSSTPSTSTTSTTAACTSTPASPMPPAIARTAPSRPASSRSSRWPPSARAMDMTWEALVENGYVVAGSPERSPTSSNELADEPARRPPHAAPADGQHAARDGASTTPRCSPSASLPNLRSKFSEYEDKWYPKMMPAEDRAVPIPGQVRMPVGVGGGQ